MIIFYNLMVISQQIVAFTVIVSDIEKHLLIQLKKNDQ